MITKINVGIDYYAQLREAIDQFSIRHGPFYKYHNYYEIDLYPSKNLSLFLIKMSDTDLRVHNRIVTDEMLL